VATASYRSLCFSCCCCCSSPFSVDGGADLIGIQDPITAAASNGRGSLGSVPPRHQRPRPHLARLPRRRLRRRRGTLLHQAHRETGSFRFTSLLSSTHSRKVNPHSLAPLLFIEGRCAVSRSGRARQRRDLHVRSA